MKPKFLTALLIVLIGLGYSVIGNAKENGSSEKDFQKIYGKADYACWAMTFFEANGKIGPSIKTGGAVLINYGSCFAVDFSSKTRIITSAHLSVFDPKSALEFINENIVGNPALSWTEISSITILKTFVIFKSTNDISLANAPEDIYFNSVSTDTMIPAEFEKMDYEADLAQLKPTDPKDYQKIKTGILGNSDKLLIGEKVMSIGNPLDHTFVASFGQITHFHVEKIKNKISRHILTTEMAGPGNSGGPLLNQEGEIVGICKGAYFINPHFGIFIPSNDIKDYLKKNK